MQNKQTIFLLRLPIMMHMFGTVKLQGALMIKEKPKY